MKRSILYIIVRPLLTLLFKIFYRPKYINKENIPADEKCILVCNHQSNFDCVFLLSSTKRVIHFLAKKELLSGIKKVIFANMGIIPVDRQNKTIDSLKYAKEALNNMEVIGIFPEGTFHTEKNKLLPFKIGAVKLAHDTNTPIIPCVIKGDYKLFSKNLSIEFLDKFYVLDEDLDKYNNKLRDLISKELND